jgi:hypothetical protein
MGELKNSPALTANCRFVFSGNRRKQSVIASSETSATEPEIGLF